MGGGRRADARGAPAGAARRHVREDLRPAGGGGWGLRVPVRGVERAGLGDGLWEPDGSTATWRGPRAPSAAPWVEVDAPAPVALGEGELECAHRASLWLPDAEPLSAPRTERRGPRRRASATRRRSRQCS